MEVLVIFLVKSSQKPITKCVEGCELTFAIFCKRLILVAKRDITNSLSMFVEKVTLNFTYF